MSSFREKNKIVACFEQNFEDSSRVGRRQWSLAVTLCETFGLSLVAMADMQFGGGTDAMFIFGFGDSLSLPCSVCPEALSGQGHGGQLCFNQPG